MKVKTRKIIGSYFTYNRVDFNIMEFFENGETVTVIDAIVGCKSVCCKNSKGLIQNISLKNLKEYKHSEFNNIINNITKLDI